ncbi:hypothetical protein PMAYCL1PPCAC_04337, partial [Pristionchus mayeri]
KEPAPGTTQHFISMAASGMLTHMLVYGLTGSKRRAFGAVLFTIPISTLMSIRDQAMDYEKWKEMASLRNKGVPDRFMPYRCKYDWTDY